jgi:hypothetical protein
MVLMVLTFSGCPPSNEIDTHPDQVWVIGDITGTLAEEIATIFVNLVAYDGVSADAPIFIAADSVELMTDTEKENVKDTFDDYYPIVVVHGTADDINALLGILELDQNYTLPDGMPYAELFAIDREEDGHVFMWSMYPPNEGAPDSGNANAPEATAYVDNADNQLERTDIFRDWLVNDEKRVSAEVKAWRMEATEALATGIKASGGELTQLAQGFVTTQNFSYSGNNYQLSYYIYSCHSFNATDSTDYDWFYVRQEGMFNASGGYEGIAQWYDGGPSDACHFYVGNYKMNNWVDGLTTASSGVALMSSNPQNANNVAQVTSGVEWNIGGSIGFQGSEAAGSLNAGVTISNSTTINVSDCTVGNNSMDAVNNAKWAYEFTKCAQTAYFGYTGLSAPPVLSRSNFQPVNQWIWKFAPSVRDSDARSFQSKFDVDLIWSVGGQPYAFWIVDPPDHYTYAGGSWQFAVPLSFPPLIVVPHNVDFGAAGQYKALDIAVSRNWTASSNQTWCVVDPLSGTGSNTRVNITVDPNATGASRTATVTFETVDGSGRDVMTVFQAQY